MYGIVKALGPRAPNSHHGVWVVIGSSGHLTFFPLSLGRNSGNTGKPKHVKTPDLGSQPFHLEIFSTVKVGNNIKELFSNIHMQNKVY